MTAKEEKLQFVRAMITKLRAFLLSSEPIVSLTDDSGQSITYARKDAWDMLQKLEQEERNLVNPNRWIRSIDLSQAY
jgi:hypothetical protein